MYATSGIREVELDKSAGLRTKTPIEFRPLFAFADSMASFSFRGQESRRSALTSVSNRRTPRLSVRLWMRTIDVKQSWCHDERSRLR